MIQESTKSVPPIWGAGEQLKSKYRRTVKSLWSQFKIKTLVDVVIESFYLEYFSYKFNLKNHPIRKNQAKTGTVTFNLLANKLGKRVSINRLTPVQSLISVSEQFLFHLMFQFKKYHLLRIENYFQTEKNMSDFPSPSQWQRRLIEGFKRGQAGNSLSKRLFHAANDRRRIWAGLEAVLRNKFA